MDIKKFKCILAILFIFVNAEVEDKTGDLFNLTFFASTSDNSDSTIVECLATLDMETINLMLLVLEIHSPVHFRGVLSAHISPVGLVSIDVEACTLDCQLSINNESEDGLLLPIYCDVSRDIVAKG